MTNSLFSLFSDGSLWRGSQTSTIRNSLPQNSALKSSTATQLNVQLNSSDKLAYFDLQEIDNAIGGGLPKGFVHEFALENSLTSKTHGRWQAPLFITANLLRSILTIPASSLAFKSIIWIGRQCWPTPVVLEASITTSDATLRQQIKDSQIFIDPQNHKHRLWSITEALRSPAVAAVIADGSKLTLLASRRLQLAAQKNGTPCLLMRPPWELQQTSSAYSRWQLRSIPTPYKHPAWELTLLRCRGITTPQSWSIALYEENTINILPHALLRTHQEKEAVLSQSEIKYGSTAPHKRTA